jgi:FixJ family two-component response regulator
MKPNVCVIDDDPSVQRAMRRLLLAAGYRVMTYSSAEDFLALTELPHPICLIVDVRMPGMTGLDLQAAISGTSRDAPIVMISGHADAATVARATAAGAVSFLCKPFEDAALLEALQRAIEEDRCRMSAQPAPVRTQPERY